MEGRVWALAYRTEGVPMLEPKIVRQIEEFSAQRWGSRRIANELGAAPLGPIPSIHALL